MKEISLNGKWMLYRQGEEAGIPAQVPGSVFHDLMENGLMEDPFYRDNEKLARELSFQDYRYERVFQVPEELLGQRRIELCCEGLDTITKIYINDCLVGETDNMFRLYELDIKSVLKAGENRIRIEFASVSEFARKKHGEKQLFQFDYAMPGMGHVRKGHYMFGWDWGPQLPDMGIFRSIALKAYEGGKLEELSFHQEHSGGQVVLTVKMDTALWQEGEVCQVRVAAPDGRVYLRETVEGICVFELEKPLLWWPYGHGEQNLYEVRASLVKGNEEIHSRLYKLGLRTMELVQEKDQWGESCYFKVNGVPVYMKGGDYIPEDNILARCHYDRTKRLLSDCIECNHNAIRVWGGGIYPEEYFYDLCDEMGIVVWQDLMFACATYDSDNQDFMETTLEEIRYNIGRIRHRACLGLICGNNEMEIAHSDWAMEDREGNQKRYLQMFEKLLPALASEAAPDVAYWLASPTSGGNFEDPNGESRGDMHYWGVWHQMEPFTAYRDVNPRFMSEFGIQSFPCLKTMETCTEPEDRNIFSRVMELHQKGGSEGNGRILHYISQLYRYPKNFEALLYISQMIQAEGVRFGVEHWRRIFGRCMGIIYWQLNDCWPVASWSSIDACGRWKALQYFSKKFFAPLLVSANDKDGQMEVYVTNDCNRLASLELIWGLYSFDGSLVRKGNVSLEIGPNRALEVTKLDFRRDLPSQTEEADRFVQLELLEDGVVVSENKVYFVPVKYMNLKKPDIRVSVEEEAAEYVFTFTTDVFVKALAVDFRAMDYVLSDNFFDLVPGREKKVTLSRERAGNIGKEVLKEQLRLMSVADTFD